MDMGKASFVILVALLALLAVAGGLLQSLAILQRLAAVSDVQGDVKVMTRPGGAYYPLTEGRLVKAGDVVRTGEGTATLNWVDGTRIKLGPGTTLKVLKCELHAATDATISLFKLDVGKVWLRVHKMLSPRSKFEVLTPTASAGVRGTLFSVEVEPTGATRVSVLEGAVAVRAAQGGEALVAPDQVAEVASRTAAGLAVGQLSAAERRDWQAAQTIIKPYLALAEPEGTRALSREGGIVVAGRAEEGTRVTVNGRAVELGRGGKFRLLLPAPRQGQLTLRVEAVDGRGQRTCIQRRVTVTPAPAQRQS
jgi:hypothetical protein